MVAKSTFAASPLKVELHARTVAVIEGDQRNVEGFYIIAHHLLRPGRCPIVLPGFSLRNRLDTEHDQISSVQRKKRCQCTVFKSIPSGFLPRHISQ